MSNWPLLSLVTFLPLVGGVFILFLRPDEARYASFENDEDGGAGDSDSDFGVGINNTMDSVAKIDKYKTIKVLLSTRRYILIKDCKDGPLLIDRDTIDYGVVLSASGKKVNATYNSVHSGDYLGDIDGYFFAQ